jgi:glutamyl-tRNA synthetase
VGHGRTFWHAFQRAKEQQGTLIMRIEDLDRARHQSEFVDAAIEDLRWLGLEWTEGPDLGGPFESYKQSERDTWYREVWRTLVATGTIYPSPHSRKDVLSALTAPHDDQENEPIFPTALRPTDFNLHDFLNEASNKNTAINDAQLSQLHPGEMNWRFRVPDGRAITFQDARFGTVTKTAGIDFGDFLVWRKDGFPSYELAVVADDHAMQITEVVRGEDLLTSTSRQILLYEAFGWIAPNWCHVKLVRDANGQRLAKRTGGLSLRELREQGEEPGKLTEQWNAELQEG